MDFRKEIDFIVEIDKVKQILRQTRLFNNSRDENDAEHSWTVCIMALIFKKHYSANIDITKVLTMLLIHDIPEIYCGDTFLYSKQREFSFEKEEKAAKDIFMKLGEMGEYFFGLWREFEERKTAEAKFASVFDRLEPLLQNYKTKGHAWKKHGIKKATVIEANKHISETSPIIWEFILSLIDECVEKGYLEE